MNSYRDNSPLCSEDCWHYSVFGGVEGCAQREDLTGNPWPEPIQPGGHCLHPKDREIHEPVYVGSALGLCALLEGTIIVGGPHDNTSIVQLLTTSKK